MERKHSFSEVNNGLTAQKKKLQIIDGCFNLTINNLIKARRNK